MKKHLTLLVGIAILSVVVGCSGGEPEADMTPPKGAGVAGAAGTAAPGAGGAQTAAPTAQ